MRFLISELHGISDLYGQDLKSAIEMMSEADKESPYEGAKEMLLVDNVENKDFLRDLLEAMYDELPAPKKKK